MTTTATAHNAATPTVTEGIELITSLTQFGPDRSNPDPNRLGRAAEAAERAGFDSALIGYRSNRPEGWMMASQALSATSRLRILLAHRPGLISPPLAARMASTLDVFSNGRITLNIVTGGSAIDQHREGDYLDHDSRYHRSVEYVEIMRRCWTATEPFDFEGKFYRLESVFHEIRPLQQPHIRLYMGGSSEGAMILAERHADVFMSWSEPLEAARQRFRDVADRVVAAGRPRPDMSLSMRLIIGETEDEAWEQAHQIVSDDLAREKAANRHYHSEDVGRNRQLEFARNSIVQDERLWMGIAALTGGLGSTGALVGTAEQVTAALLRYVEAGATALLLTDPAGNYGEFPAGFLAALRSQADSILAGSEVKKDARRAAL